MLGCAESHEGLIRETIQMIDQGGVDVANITKEVKAATEYATEKQLNKLDLKLAEKATEKLKLTGDKTQEIKSRIAKLGSSISEDDRKQYAKNNAESLNTSFKKLIANMKELRDALDAAERIDPVAVSAFRKKLVEAEGPFEAQARQ
jgi:uncharacterized lipoprotein NlpE involved in copper resistance